MRKLRYIGKVIWEGIFLLNFLSWLLIMYLPFRYLFANPKRWKAAMKLQRIWAGSLRITMGIRTKITYETTLDPKATYIYTPNHTSFLDILAAYKYIPNYFHFMAKASLAKIPLFRIMFWKTHIPFERSSKNESSLAYDRACADLAKGYSILVYPEGTQNSKKGTLLNFKSGAFRMAVQQQVPVVPVTHFNHLDIIGHPKGFFKLAKGGPGISRTLVGTPVHPSECDNDPGKLQEKVYEIIGENLRKYYAAKAAKKA